MHEASLIASVLRQSLGIATANGPGDIVEIHLSYGPLAGIERALLASAFERLAPEYGLAAAALCLHEQELTAACRACQLEYRVIDFEFACPSCGSSDAEVVAGDALTIESLTLRPPTDSVPASTIS